MLLTRQEKILQLAACSIILLPCLISCRWNAVSEVKQQCSQSWESIQVGNPIDLSDSAAPCLACFGINKPFGYETPEILRLNIFDMGLRSQPPVVGPVPASPNGYYMLKQTATACAWHWSDFHRSVSVSLTAGCTTIYYNNLFPLKTYFSFTGPGCIQSGKNQAPSGVWQGGEFAISFGGG